MPPRFLKASSDTRAELHLPLHPPSPDGPHPPLAPSCVPCCCVSCKQGYPTHGEAKDEAFKGFKRLSHPIPIRYETYDDPMASKPMDRQKKAQGDMPVSRASPTRRCGSFAARPRSTPWKTLPVSLPPGEQSHKYLLYTLEQQDGFTRPCSPREGLPAVGLSDGLVAPQQHL